MSANQKPGNAPRLVPLGSVVLGVCPELAKYFSRSELGDKFADFLDRLFIEGLERNKEEL